MTEFQGVEVKRTDRPRPTPSMHHALADIDLDRVIVVHAGDQSFPLAPRIEAVAAHRLLTEGFPASSSPPV